MEKVPVKYEPDGHISLNRETMEFLLAKYIGLTSKDIFNIIRLKTYIIKGAFCFYSLFDDIGLITYWSSQEDLDFRIETFQKDKLNLMAARIYINQLKAIESQIIETKDTAIIDGHIINLNWMEEDLNTIMEDLVAMESIREVKDIIENLIFLREETKNKLKLLRRMLF